MKNIPTCDIIMPLQIFLMHNIISRKNDILNFRFTYIRNEKGSK